MKAVLHFNAGPEFQQRLSALKPDWLEIAIVETGNRTLLADKLVQAEVLLHVLEPVTVDVLSLAPRLRFIQKIGVGVNTIDIDSAVKKGIAVANMPGTNTQAVAEMTLALMLSVLRRIHVLETETRAGRGWTINPAVFDDISEISGSVIGFFGFGAVPQALAPALTALGAKLIYTATNPKDTNVAEWRTLPDLLAEADILSLHAPLTAETEKVIDARALAMMKRGAVLINTARGSLVEEDALVQALKSNHLRGAGLDVFAQEPVNPANPLLELDNVVSTPHIAWLTPATLKRSLIVAFENCRRLREGEALRHQVI